MESFCSSIGDLADAGLRPDLHVAQKLQYRADDLIAAVGYFKWATDRDRFSSREQIKKPLQDWSNQFDPTGVLGLEAWQ